MNVRKLVTMAMFAALSIVLVFFIHLPIFPSAPYLEYDPADIPILIGTFAFGPVAGLILTVVVSVLQWLTVSPQSQIWGALMHILATGAFALVAGIIYKKKKSRTQAAMALLCGAASMVAVMAVANYIITPIYTGMPREAVAALLVPTIIPFNIIKAGINGLVTFLIYKPISRILHKGELQEP